MPAQLLKRLRRSTLAKFGFTIFIVVSLAIGITGWNTSVQSHEVPGDCSAITAGKFYRFVPAQDACFKPMRDEATRKLNDPFAKRVLRRGMFPDSVDAITEAIADIDEDYIRTVYAVGETTQIPLSEVPREHGSRGISYLITWGPNENQADVMFSTTAPTSTTSVFEIMAWDADANLYNFYEFRQQSGKSGDSPRAWIWAGDTSLAPQPPVMEHSCFNCHHNGLPIMKELERPWSNWHSQRSVVSSTLVPSAVASEPFFQQRRNAEIFETVVRGSFQNYYKNWLNERVRTRGRITAISDVDKMLRYVTTNTTVNFATSDVPSSGTQNSPLDYDIAGVPPRDTFLWDSIFQNSLGLDYSSLSVDLDRDAYDAYLKKHNFNLVVSQGKAIQDTIPGSTYFAYLVPQIAAEDIYMTQQLLQQDILSEKFVAALLMVDFKNPLFSEKRTRLQSYANTIKSGQISRGKSSIPDDFAARIEKTGAKACSAADFDSCTEEEQFLYTWQLPDRTWKQETRDRLQDYIDSIVKLPARERVEFFMNASIQQRNRFASILPFCKMYEFSEFMPQTNLSQAPSCQE